MRRLQATAFALALLLGGASLAGATCVTTVTVVPGSLQTDVNVLSTVTVSGGDYCFNLTPGTYSESVAIASVTFGDTQSRVIFYSTGPASSVVISAPGGGTMFSIGAASVTLEGVTLTPTASGGYGVQVSSPNVSLSSMTVSDTTGMLSSAGVLVTAPDVSVNLSTVSVTVGSAGGLDAAGATRLAVTSSYFYSASSSAVTLLGTGAGSLAQSQVVAGGAAAALLIQNSSTDTITQDWINNPSGGAARLVLASSNTISLSTITSNSASFAALYLSTSTNNGLSNDYIASPVSDGVLMDGNANNNTISGSTMYSSIAATYAALRMLASSSNTITQSFITAPNGSAALVDNGSTYNTISQSTITIAQNIGAPVSVAYGSIGNTLTQSYVQDLFTGSVGVSLVGGADYFTLSQSTIVVNGAGSTAVSVGVAHSTVTLTEVIAAGGTGIQSAGLGDVVTNSSVSATTAFLVKGATGTLIGSDVLQASGAGGAALVVQQGAALTQISGSTLTASGGAQAALLNAPGPLQATGPLVLRGAFTINSGAFDAGSFSHAFGGDLDWGGAQSLTLGGSTITLDGANDSPAATSQQVVAPASGAGFNSLIVNVSSAIFLSNPFSASSFVDTVAGSTVAFQSGLASPYSFQSFKILGGPGAQHVVVRATTAGTAAPISVAVSSISFASVSDSSSTAATIQANDGTSLNLGNDPNWNFLPFLVVAPQGDSYVNGSGLTGTPSATAGGATVHVYAVSAASQTLTSAAFPVSLTSDDPNEPTITPQNLSAGVASFSLQVRTARTDTFQALSASTWAFTGASAQASQTVSPAAFTRLLLLLPGETAAPGTAAGYTGSPSAALAGVAFSPSVESVDAWSNLVSTGTDQIVLSTTGANLPLTQSLVSGATTFSVVFSTTAASRALNVTDATNAGIASSTSPSFGVLAPTSSSPTVSIGIALNSVQTTLNGGLSGAASDLSGVTQVRAALRRIGTAQYFNWQTQSFSSPSIAYATTTLSAPNGTSTNWSIPVADALMVNDTYYAVAIASNVIGAYTVAETTFVFQSGGLAAGSGGDGQGTATAVSSLGPIGCQVLVASITFTVGPAGLQSGGAVALQLPLNWQTPTTTDTVNDPPLNPGYVHVVTTATYSLQFNPSSYAGAPLGSNWMVFSPSSNMTPGQPVQFVYKGFPGAGPSAVGAQIFSLMSQGASSGNLKPIAVQPSFSLQPGPAQQLVFNPNLPLTVGALQTSPTMQLLVTDACGNSTNTAAALPIALNAGQYGAPDTSASFYLANGTLLGPSGATLNLPGNVAGSPGFYFVTSASGFENVIATATLGPANAFASRYVTVLTSSVSLTSVSIDTGTPSPGVKTATMTGTSFQGAAVINFTLSNPSLNWEVIISTSPSDFYPEIVHRFGTGNPGRTLTWNGINERVYPQRYLPPGGPYYIKIRAAGGVVEDNSLTAYIAPTASIYGTVNSTGAYAYVQAYGPNANYANFAVASSTGFFQIFGLQNNVQYNVQATTGIVTNGQLLTLNSTANGVTAVNAGTNVGAIPFPTQALLRVNVQIPSAAPVEFWGGLNVHTQDYARTAFGTLHYILNADHSDNGAQSFGTKASTWTEMGLLPGTYNVDINLPQVGISSTVSNVVVGPGVTDLAVSLPRKANVYGYAVLPSTTANGAWVSVQGVKAGDLRPSLFGGAFVPGGVSQTSATYALYGLDPGSWTITARAFGFGSISSNVYVSSSADIGNPTTGGFDLFVSSGGVLKGVVNLVGDSSQLPGLNNSQSGVTLWVNAYNPQTYASGGTQVTLSTSATLASSTFSITGLDNGAYFINAFLNGAAPVQMSTTVAAGVGNATLNVQVNSSHVALTIKLPGAQPPSEYHNVSLFQSGSGGPHLIQDITSVGSIQYFPSSATWLSPAVGAGYYSLTAYYSRTGMFQTLSVPLTNSQTSAATMDLSGSTYSVSGTVLLSANVNFHQGTNVVSVSSMTAMLADSVSQQYCLMGAPNSISTSAFHMELLPVSPFGGGFLNDALMQTANCANPNVPNNVGGNSPNPFLAYIASVSVDGSFQFANVPAGAYLLRMPTSLDGSGTDQLPPVRQVVTVSSSTTGIVFNLGSGITVSGNVLLPPGLTATRPFGLSLLDSTGQTIKQAWVNVNNANSAPYSFSQVPNGGFAIRIQDFGSPQVYGARPISFKAAGVDLPGQDIQLVRTGIIKGKLAVQQTLAGSTTQQYILISQNNFSLLPTNNLQLFAEANPWFQGGQVNAQNFSCQGGCFGFSLDSNDQFVISNVLPGTYDVNLQSYNDPNNNSTLRVVSSKLPGVSVGEGQVTDVGTFNLSGATQLQGTVYDVTTSSPIANITVAAEPSVAGASKHDTPQATTDASGHYTLVGLDPSVKLYDIYANFRGGGSSGGSLPNYALKVQGSVDITTTSLLNFALTPAPYSVSGRVVGVAGGPPLQDPFNSGNSDVASPGAMVFFQKTTDLPHDNPIADITVPTDANGNFTITALTTGTYKMVVASLNYSSLSQYVSITSASVNLGTLSLGLGGSLSGAIRKPDGTYPSPHEVDFVGAVTSDFSQLLVATKSQDPNTNTITGYSISGFKPGVTYQLIIGDDSNGFSTPPEARTIVFSTTTESRTLDVVLRPSQPIIIAKARHSGSGYIVSFELSKPLREKTQADDSLSNVLSTFSALGSLSQIQLSPDRSLLTAFYTPGVNESSFTLRFNGYSTLTNPDSIDPINPEFVYLSTFAFYAGVDGYLQNNVSNMSGGTLVVDGNNGRVGIPGGAFSVDASSSIQVTFQTSAETLAGATTSGLRGAAANIAALRANGAAYPTDLLKALAAAPAGVNPLSSFYNILLPLGVRTALQKPVQMTIAYSTGTDPTTLNLYWYNAAANAYVLQQDVTGAKPVIDYTNHTITINVNHFSTFVLFNSGVAVISGNTFSGGDIEAYNFPNPFDLTTKSVATIHGGGSPSIRGTMIRFALPSDASGDASIRIFNVAGERVRKIDMGTLNGGQYYYQEWDGRNDAGRDVASGVYIGQVKVGSKSKFFKMALIK